VGDQPLAVLLAQPNGEPSLGVQDLQDRVAIGDRVADEDPQPRSPRTTPARPGCGRRTAPSSSGTPPSPGLAGGEVRRRSRCRRRDGRARRPCPSRAPLAPSPPRACVSGLRPWPVASGSPIARGRSAGSARRVGSASSATGRGPVRSSWRSGSSGTPRTYPPPADRPGQGVGRRRAQVWRSSSQPSRTRPQAAALWASSSSSTAAAVKGWVQRRSPSR
jgi:hypothetical protein